MELIAENPTFGVLLAMLWLISGGILAVIVTRASHRLPRRVAAAGLIAQAATVASYYSLIALRAESRVVLVFAATYAVYLVLLIGAILAWYGWATWLRDAIAALVLLIFDRILPADATWAAIPWLVVLAISAGLLAHDVLRRASGYSLRWIDGVALGLAIGALSALAPIVGGDSARGSTPGVVWQIARVLVWSVALPAGIAAARAASSSRYDTTH